MFSVSASGGIVPRVSGDVCGTVSYIQECSGRKCGEIMLDGNISGTASAQIKVLISYRLPHRAIRQLVEFNFSPVGLSISITGNIGWDFCENRIAGELCVNPLIFESEVNIAGFQSFALHIPLLPRKCI